MMKMYALSLGVGVLVGVLYYLLNVKSPAPPFVALGLLGMVVGEKLIPLLKTLTSENRSDTAQAWSLH